MSKIHEDKSNEKLGVPKGHYPLVVDEVSKRDLHGEMPITCEYGTTQEFGAKLTSSPMYVQQNSSVFTLSLTDLYTQAIHAARQWQQGSGSQFSFKSSKQEGAILVPGGNIDIKDALESVTSNIY